MGLFSEFKTFVSKGNVLDLAIGVIIGSAFGKIVSSFVADIIMPPIGMALGGVNFTELKTVLRHAVVDASGKVISPAVTVNYGNFFQNVIDFLIIAFVIFMAIKAINRFKRKEEVVVVVETPAEIALLTEIRDLLKK
ncbi:MAG: large-conductance mechanosensitive channel protein MscL [Bacteroidota bacterium]